MKHYRIPLLLTMGAVLVVAVQVAVDKPSSAALLAQGESEQLSLQVEIPRLSVSEYHRPYIAMWIQDQKNKAVVDLAVWYQVKGPEKDFGAKWLPDLRTWWRRSGRSQKMPIDGVTAATRPVGNHTLTFDEERFAKLTPGTYTLMVEAVREVGGREVIEIPFEWPSKKAVTYRDAGKTELGNVVLTVKP